MGYVCERKILYKAHLNAYTLDCTHLLLSTTSRRAFIMIHTPEELKQLTELRPEVTEVR